MAKFWSLLFGTIPIWGVGTFIYGYYTRLDLPPDVSEHGHRIDSLYHFILWLTGIVFVATTVTLAYFLWKYGNRKTTERAKFTHGSHDLELVWTIIPAATLVFIAIYQMNTWADSKYDSRKPDTKPLLEVTARQFEWRLRYPGADGLLGTRDDIHLVNDIHIPVDTDILLELKSMDVLHSFFLPNLRVKQDAVPGMKIPVWFRATEKGSYDLVCAELCGWGHYKMKGRLTVESREDFEKWLAEQAAAQEASQ